MEDGGDPEEVEGGVEAVVGNGSPAGSRAIGRNVIGLGRNVKCGEIGASQPRDDMRRSEEHTSELQSLMRLSSAVFCLKKKTRFVDAKRADTSFEAARSMKQTTRQTSSVTWCYVEPREDIYEESPHPRIV